MEHKANKIRFILYLKIRSLLKYFLAYLVLYIAKTEYEIKLKIDYECYVSGRNCCNQKTSEDIHIYKLANLNHYFLFYLTYL